MLEALEKRNADVGKVLLNDIINELIVKKVTVSEKVIMMIRDRYLFFNGENDEKLMCDYMEFCHMYLY